MTSEEVYYAFKELKDSIFDILTDNPQICEEYHEGDQEESNEDIEDMLQTLNDMLAIASGHEDEIDNDDDDDDDNEFDEEESEEIDTDDEVTIKKKG